MYTLMDNYFTDIIGKGMTFPIKLNRNENGETGWYPVNGDMELVRNNINSILYYMIGQRFRQENFGNRLWECIEEPNLQALSFIIKEFIKTAIGTWEQRLTFKGIKVARVDAKVNIEVEYSINGTGSSQYLYLTYNNLDNSLNTK
jgi:phage baseplate assembly protein W|nr:MAG TPA: baseplate assembly protein [Caudoviricetes sp.]